MTYERRSSVRAELPFSRGTSFNPCGKLLDVTDRPGLWPATSQHQRKWMSWHARHKRSGFEAPRRGKGRGQTGRDFVRGTLAIRVKSITPLNRGQNHEVAGLKTPRGVHLVPRKTSLGIFQKFSRFRHDAVSAKTPPPRVGTHRNGKTSVWLKPCMKPQRKGREQTEKLSKKNFWLESNNLRFVGGASGSTRRDDNAVQNDTQTQFVSVQRRPPVVASVKSSSSFSVEVIY